MADHYKCEKAQFPGRHALECLRGDSSFGVADSGLLSRLAEEMYGELAFARAATSHPRAGGTPQRSGPLSYPGSAKSAAADSR